MDNKSKILEKLQSLLDDLEKITKEVTEDSIQLCWNRLERWKEKAIIAIRINLSNNEGEKFEKKNLSVFSMDDPMGNFKKEADIYYSHIKALMEEIETNSDFILRSQVTDNKICSDSSLEKVEKICKAFHRVARQLRVRHSKRQTFEVDDEYDVQDLIHALLKIDFKDVRPEEWTESNAGKSSRIDFLLKEEKVVIEIKKTRKGFTDKEIGDELIIDIDRYKSHTKCDYLTCFIYDPEARIGNPYGLISDLEDKSTDDLKIKVIVEPKV